MLDIAAATPRTITAKSIEWTLSPLRNREYGTILGHLKDKRFKSLRDAGLSTHDALIETEKMTFEVVADKLDKSNDLEFILMYVFTSITRNHPTYTLQSFNDLFEFGDPELKDMYKLALTISHPRQIAEAQAKESEKKSL